jgi:uncharacterized membrane protein
VGRKGCGCLIFGLAMVNLLLFLVFVISIVRGLVDLTIVYILVLLVFLVNGGLLLVFGLRTWQSPSLINGGSEEGEEDEDEDVEGEAEDKESEES